MGVASTCFMGCPVWRGRVLPSVPGAWEQRHGCSRVRNSANLGMVLPALPGSGRTEPGPNRTFDFHLKTGFPGHKICLSTIAHPSCGSIPALAKPIVAGGRLHMKNQVDADGLEHRGRVYGAATITKIGAVKVGGLGVGQEDPWQQPQPFKHCEADF